MEITNVVSSYAQEYPANKETVKSKEAEKEVAKTQVDGFVKSDKSEAKSTYGKIKKLTPEQVKELKEEQQRVKGNMLKRMMEANLKNQANVYGMSEKSQNLIKQIFGSIEEGLPPLATTPEEAQKAIQAGGAYSVEAVAERIMKMAKALAGGDPEKISLLRGAVEEGFKQAGIDFKKMAHQKLPQICLDTYEEVMKQFDTWEKKV